MRQEDFIAGFPGTLVETYGKALGYIPDPLPAFISLAADVLVQSDQAMLAVGRLDQLGRSLPNPYLLIQPFIRREAVASSRMEGTTADVGQLVLYEAAGVLPGSDSDVREVANYVTAVNYGLNRPTDRPVSVGLVREMHHLLLDGVRGGQARPGQYREQQNWIGRHGQAISDARFVPPPPDQVAGLMLDLEQSWQAPPTLPALIRLALIHYQFETIHPFLDGNGRLGRLLMSVLLDDWGVLGRPLLYLSSAIEPYREEYQDGLLRLSQTGDWNAWVRFFLRAVGEAADDALARGNRLLELQTRLNAQYKDRGMVVALKLVDELFVTPAFSVSAMAERLGVTYEALRRTVERLTDEEVLTEVTGQQRNRVYVASEIVRVVNPLQA